MSAMDDFPHGRLHPSDVTPRITPESAAEVCRLVREAREAGMTRFDPVPAIIVAVFDGVQEPPIGNPETSRESGGGGAMIQWVVKKVGAFPERYLQRTLWVMGLPVYRSWLQLEIRHET